MPGFSICLSLCLMTSIIISAMMTEQMSAMGWAKIRPSRPIRALAMNSTGRKMNHWRLTDRIRDARPCPMPWKALLFTKIMPRNGPETISARSIFTA